MVLNLFINRAKLDNFTADGKGVFQCFVGCRRPLIVFSEDDKLTKHCCNSDTSFIYGENTKHCSVGCSLNKLVQTLKIRYMRTVPKRPSSFAISVSCSFCRAMVNSPDMLKNGLRIHPLAVCGSFTGPFPLSKETFQSLSYFVSCLFLTHFARLCVKFGRSSERDVSERIR